MFNLTTISFLINTVSQVQAFALLATRMLNTTDTTTVPYGQAYFISDGTPVSNFHFLKPLCEARKRVFPSTVIPTSFMLAVSHVMESLYFGLKWLSGGRIRLVPVLTRAEVLKVGVTHYFSIGKMAVVEVVVEVRLIEQLNTVVLCTMVCDNCEYYESCVLIRRFAKGTFAPFLVVILTFYVSYCMFALYTDKARRELTYQPTVTTSEGAARIAAYYSTPGVYSVMCMLVVHAVQKMCS